jgi:23S rRNA (cytidine2498-2'-O)-methyltransferase
MPNEVLSAYWAPEKFESELAHELGSDLVERHGRLLLSSKPAREVVWAHNIWTKAELIPIVSIGDAAKKLRERRGFGWVLNPIEQVRRSTLIEEQLGRKIKPKPLKFLETPSKSFGEFSLLSQDLMVASTETTAKVPFGDAIFEESKEAPSRAYLKLWETFTLENFSPSAGQKCMDLGACPGGWTWVLANLGAHVISVDKADLDPKVLRMPHVTQLKKDAFKLKPSDIGPLDWLFSDVICEPRRLLELVHEWLESGLCHNFVCTIKFKGKTDFEVLNDFLKIEGSRARHLFANKHEVTWWLQKPLKT